MGAVAIDSDLGPLRDGRSLQRGADQRDRRLQVAHDQRRRNPQHAVAQPVKLAVAAGVRGAQAQRAEHLRVRATPIWERT